MGEALGFREKERWITAIFFGLSGILSATWSSRIPDIQQKLGLNNTAWGAVLFALPVGLVVGLSVASWIVTKFGTKTIMLAGCVLAALVLCLAGLVNTPVLLVLSLFSVGFVRTIFSIAVNTGSIDVQRLYERPVIATFHGIWSISCFVAAALATVMIIAGISPDIHFVIVAIAVVVVGVLAKPGGRSETGSIEKRPFFVKPDNYLFILGLIAFCGMFAESAMFDWSVNYFDKVVGAGKRFSTAGYTAFIIAMAAGRFAGDQLIHKYGVFVLMRFNGLLMAVGFAVAVFFPFLVPAILGFVLVGLGDSIIIPAVYSLAAKTKKMPPSYALASVTMIGYAGFLSGPLLIGFISDAFSMKWAFALVCVVSLCIVFLSVQLRKVTLV
jgi:MFS family permease